MKFIVPLLFAFTFVSFTGCGPSKGTTELNPGQGKMDKDAAPPEGV
jgi:hypothetical protein